jgi:hypothetical protein
MMKRGTVTRSGPAMMPKYLNSQRYPLDDAKVVRRILVEFLTSAGRCKRVALVKSENLEKSSGVVLCRFIPSRLYIRRVRGQSSTWVVALTVANDTGEYNAARTVKMNVRLFCVRLRCSRSFGKSAHKRVHAAEEIVP